MQKKRQNTSAAIKMCLAYHPLQDRILGTFTSNSRQTTVDVPEDKPDPSSHGAKRETAGAAYLIATEVSAAGAG